jgi:PBP1b-binding outer membrane lipoprotein LpoB
MIRFLFILLTLCIFIACTNRKSSLYQESSNTQLNTLRWNANDLKEFSKKMISSILSSSKIDFSKTLIYSFGKIRNDSYDHIDTKALTHKISTALIKSTKMNITNDQNISHYIFEGKISSILKQNQQSKDMFFTFNLTLIQQKTAKIVWSHDVEIRKIYKRALLSW